MRALSTFALLLAVGLTGCATKNVRVGGTMCPEGTVEGAQANPDAQECRFYGPAEEKAAGKASYPPGTQPESGKTLEEQGYKISE